MDDSCLPKPKRRWYQFSRLWKTEDATLVLGGSGWRTVELPGEDRGDLPAVRIDNFAWGTLTAQVPEPATIWMIAGVLPLAWLAIRRYPIKPSVA